MGTLNQAIDIASTIEEFGIVNVVETGTGPAETIEVLLQVAPNLKGIYSIEIIPEILEAAAKKFAGRADNLHLLLGASKDVLETLIPELEGATLFWLDAHFPGADFGFAEYWSEPDPSLRIPLETELRLITLNRDVSKDFFVMDDLRVYEEGPFTAGNWAFREQAGGYGVGFVYELLSATHDITRSYEKQGFLICSPKTR